MHLNKVSLDRGQETKISAISMIFIKVYSVISRYSATLLHVHQIIQTI
ncbi:protein of unknown function (plasmid) [Legionella hackeliae]|uniref:Uncharacterized protein n=1 Tax=Legionella hackeliae TaxID=449 RepID=A0A0A8UTT9_LEGHA|nr:protein of unknown function [Legionella hackeliae]